MIKPVPQPDMAWHLRRLLEAVKDACGREGPWRWLTGPMALLMWFRTRRERQEAAMAMAAVQGLLEAFIGLIEDFRAGKLVAQDAPDGGVGAAAPPPPQPSPQERERGRAAPAGFVSESRSLQSLIFPVKPNASSWQRNGFPPARE